MKELPQEYPCSAIFKKFRKERHYEVQIASVVKECKENTDIEQKIYYQILLARILIWIHRASHASAKTIKDFRSLKILIAKKPLPHGRTYLADHENVMQNNLEKQILSIVDLDVLVALQKQYKADLGNGPAVYRKGDDEPETELESRGAESASSVSTEEEFLNQGAIPIL